MSKPLAEAVSHVEIRGIITRLDGSTEDLGVISAQYKNPFRRLWWKAVGSPLANRRIRKWNASKKESP